LANNTDKLRTPGQFLRSIPFSKVQHGLYTIASHHQELGLNFKVVEGGVNVVGIWKKIHPESFFGYSNKSWGLELNKNLFENLPLRKDHPSNESTEYGVIGRYDI